MKQETREKQFQQDVIHDMLQGGWQIGASSKYDRKRALYTEDCLAYVQNTQPETWEKYQQLNPDDPEGAFLDKLASQLAKADPHASDKSLRTFGTLGVLRHGLRDRSATFQLCQFKPEHDLNPETQAGYHGNILRVVQELVYSPYLTGDDDSGVGLRDEEDSEGGQGKKSKSWRIDLVLFVNGLPVATLELKSEFQQGVERALRQYKKDRRPKDPATGKPEPLLTFKRGALVHFAVSQYQAYMTTRLDGDDTRFLPFNKGTSDGAAGNDVPDDPNEYATAYLWKDVLARDNLLDILGRFLHLKIETEETWEGRKRRKETLIFPRYHQWNLVRRLITKTKEEGPGHKYLVQHSAGSGKSNSIAWTAHQLASLYVEGSREKLFHSVIVVTDRTVLDDQLQDTIYQFEHADGVVGRIHRREGQGSKSEKLAAALEQSQPIIIVTLQTFQWVLQAIEDSVSLSQRRYAIVADEAHSSQSGRTAGQLKSVLSLEGREEETVSAEDLLVASVEARRPSPNLSYYAFTATPKGKTLELFGRLPHPDQPKRKPDNWYQPFDVYSMRQAIEEGYILDVLKNYTSYEMAYRLAQKVESRDAEVDSQKARVQLGKWLRLHDTNIRSKVREIVDHFQQHVRSHLGGQAKAMIVTGSRKEAVRYGLEFAKYVEEQGLDLTAMTAFSGEVTFTDDDPNAADLVGREFTEATLNPGLKGRDMRKAFDTPEYQVMIVAEKFQTGFDQPKLCAMYVDKKLAGLDCVQTLSRLNRTYPNKVTSILDFVNDPDDVLAAFQEYYQTAELRRESDPNLVWDLLDKLKAADIFRWDEVVHFVEVFFSHRGNAALRNLCEPAAQRWGQRYRRAREEHAKFQQRYQHAKSVGDPTVLGNAEDDMKEAKRELDALTLFKSDLASFTRSYEFLTQIVTYDSTELEALNLYALHLAPLLREEVIDEPIDLSSVELRDFRLAMKGQRQLQLRANAPTDGLTSPTQVGTGRAREKEEELLSEVIRRMNELFPLGDLPSGSRTTDQDLLSYAQTIRDKMAENEAVMRQIENNPPEQALLGDFNRVLDDIIIDSGAAHQSHMHHYLNHKDVQAGFARLIFDMLLAEMGRRGRGKRR